MTPEPLRVCETPFGKFQIQPGDGISDTTATGVLWDGAGFLQPIFREHYRPGTTVIDIGANIGTFSIWAAHSGAWRVIAVEPIPQTMLMLKASLALNRFCDDVVIPLEVAAWDKVTRLAIEKFDPLNLGASAVGPVDIAGTEIPVSWIDARPLDEFRFLFGAQVSLIKCDAQGSDLKALLGLHKTIAQDHPVIVFEWEQDPADIKPIMLELGYAWRPWPTHPNNFIAWSK